MWSANGRPSFLNTDNPTVDQGSAALSAIKGAVASRGQRINWPGLDRQPETQQI